MALLLNTTVTGTLEVSGAVTFASTLGVTGAVTGASFNGLVVTATTGTLTVAAAKTLTVSNSITLTGTDGASYNLATMGGVADGDKGEITVSASGATWTIDAGVVTLAKMAHMATNRIIGRTTAGTGVPELLTISGTGSVAMTDAPEFGYGFSLGREGFGNITWTAGATGYIELPDRITSPTTPSAGLVRVFNRGGGSFGWRDDQGGMARFFADNNPTGYDYYLPAVTGTVAVAATTTTATHALFGTTTAGAPAYRAVAGTDLTAALKDGTIQRTVVQVTAVSVNGTAGTASSYVSVASGANPTFTTSAAHGFSVGTVVTISGIAGAGATVANGTWTVATAGTPTTFTVGASLTTSGASAGTTGIVVGANVTKITTATAHGYAAGDKVIFSGLSGPGGPTDHAANWTLNSYNPALTVAASPAPTSLEFYIAEAVTSIAQTGLTTAYVAKNDSSVLTLQSTVDTYGNQTSAGLGIGTITLKHNPAVHDAGTAITLWSRSSTADYSHWIFSAQSNLQVGSKFQVLTGSTPGVGAMVFDTGPLQTIIQPYLRTSGSTPYFVVTTPADITLAASTECIGSNFTAATRQFATGTIERQRERVFAAPTYGFVGASTVTEAINVDIALPAAGTNATLTNAYALRSGHTLVLPTTDYNAAQNGNLKISPVGVTANMSSSIMLGSTSGGTGLNGVFTIFLHQNGNSYLGTSGGILRITTGYNSSGATILTLDGTGAKVEASLGVGAAASTTSFAAIAAGTTAKAQINLAAGTAPTSPANGDIWFDGTDLKMRVGGVTKTFTLA